MAYDSKQVVALIEQTGYLVARLQSMPQVIPIALEILQPLLPPAKSPSPKKRQMSDATRRKMRVAMLRRWKLAKKAGKTTVGKA